MRVVGLAALVLLVAFGAFVVRRLVRSWRDTYGGARDDGHDQG